MSFLDKVRNELNPKEVRRSSNVRAINMAISEIPRD